MNHVAVPPPVRRGRPRKFDRTEALGQAVRLFWEQGYEGTSLQQLISAMGISVSSFQNAFGSKERLYEEAAQFYLDEKARWFHEALSEDRDAREVFEKLFESTADAFTVLGDPAGCMISLAGTHAAPECERISAMMAAKRGISDEAMQKRLQSGIAAGELPPDTDTVALASFFSTVVRGMAVQARDGASREELRRIGAMAMRAWPG